MRISDWSSDVFSSDLSAGLMPQPSSLTSTRSVPPPDSEIAIRVAPASIAFSTNSFNALAGLSTTSPAAMRLTRCSGRRRIDMDKALDQSARSREALTVLWTRRAGAPYRGDTGGTGRGPAPRFRGPEERSVGEEG